MLRKVTDSKKGYSKQDKNLEEYLKNKTTKKLEE